MNFLAVGVILLAVGKYVQYCSSFTNVFLIPLTCSHWVIVSFSFCVFPIVFGGLLSRRS